MDKKTEKKMIKSLNTLAEITGGNAWHKGDKFRVYYTKGYAVLDEPNKVNIDRVGGHLFMTVKAAAIKSGFEVYRK